MKHCRLSVVSGKCSYDVRIETIDDDTGEWREADEREAGRVSELIAQGKLRLVPESVSVPE